MDLNSIFCITSLEANDGNVKPTAGKQTGDKKKGLSPVVWAVPVAIVGLILIIILGIFIRKSRRLERSMFALMTRRSVDEDGAITFHSGEYLLWFNFILS